MPVPAMNSNADEASADPSAGTDRGRESGILLM